MKTVPFFEACAEAVVDLERQQIATREAGKEIGRGGAFYVRTLGTAAIQGQETHIAIKKGYTVRGGVYVRLLTDLSVSAFLSMYAPEVIPKLPTFVAGLAIPSSPKPIALLTEDVSKSGELYVSSRPIRPMTLKYLKEALGEFGNPSDIFDLEEMQGTLAFRVGDDEKFLDNDPSSFINIDRLDQLFTQAMELSEDGRFFVKANSDSPLVLTA